MPVDLLGAHAETASEATPPDDTHMPGAKHRRTQLERRQDSEQRLLEAALQIVAEQGATRMTLAEVGERAGLSRGLVAHRFGSRAGLLRALAAAVGDSFKDKMRSGPKRSGGLDALTGLIEHYFVGISTLRPSSRALLVLMTESSISSSELADSLLTFNRETIGFVTAQLRLAKAKGQIAADIEADSAAVVLLGILRGVMLHRLVDPDSFDPIAVRAQALLAMRRFLGADVPA